MQNSFPHPVALRCESLREPLNVERSHPGLSWQLQDVERRLDTRQTAYHILVSTDPSRLSDAIGECWDSGWVESAKTRHIPYVGAPLKAGAPYFWKVRLRDGEGRESAWSEPAHWRMGLMGATGQNASWITVPGAAAGGPSPLLRCEFEVESGLVSAMLHMTALGLYEARLNGRRVGHQVLSPEWTDYHQRVQYQSYDVTAQLLTGRNCLSALLGDGWYCGRLGLSAIVPGGPSRGIYGPRPLLWCVLQLEYEDGRKTQIATDANWHGTLDGPLRHADLLDGETFDARLWPQGWDLPHWDANDWRLVETDTSPTARIEAQTNEPIRITQLLTPIAITEPQPRVYIFDLGQNMAGWCRFKVRAPQGTHIRLRHAEVLDESGHIYRDNLRLGQDHGGAAQEDTYIASGQGEEIYEPRFTYHGFRYVEVTGLPYVPALSDLEGCVLHSDVEPALGFSCSNELLQRLWQAIDWTLRGNLHSVPTDCPQRDERLGWMGDAQVFSQTANFARNMQCFWTKWLQDVRDAQTEDGRFPDFAPHPYDSEVRFSANLAWADAGVIVPWNHWINYADQQTLESHFEAATRWVDYVHRHNPDLIWSEGQGHPLVYGDWLNGDSLELDGWPKEGGAVPIDVFATAFFAHSCALTAKMAEALNRPKEAARYGELAAQVRRAFGDNFVDADGRIQGDTQAGYALALHFDLLLESQRAGAFQNLVAAVEKYGGRPSTGIQSTIRLFLELSRGGRHDLALAIATSTAIPSWGYMIEQGGTTIWERWDGFVAGRGFQNKGMNSFNHYAFGALGEWIVRTLIGISPDEAHPGYTHFFVKPHTAGLDWVRGHFDSPQGRIEVAWSKEDGDWTLDIVVPPNAQATLLWDGMPSHLPNTPAETKLVAGQHSFRSSG